MVLINDNVGIGTNSPSEKLEVNGNIKGTGNLSITGTSVFNNGIQLSKNVDGQNKFIMSNTDLNSNAENIIQLRNDVGGLNIRNFASEQRSSIEDYGSTSKGLTIQTVHGDELVIKNSKSTGKIILNNDNTDILTITKEKNVEIMNGNVGIGVLNPTKKLEVLGDMKINGQIDVEQLNFEKKNLNKLKLPLRTIPNNNSSLTTNYNNIDYYVAKFYKLIKHIFIKTVLN